jgi:hypothetical protein
MRTSHFTIALLIGISVLFAQKEKARGHSDIPDIRFQNAGQIQTYIDQNGGQPSGKVCYAETGRVYLRGDSLKPGKRTLENGTYINFIGTRNGYAWVQVMRKTNHEVFGYYPDGTAMTSYSVVPTNEYGYITARYTCGYGY